MSKEHTPSESTTSKSAPDPHALKESGTSPAAPKGHGRVKPEPEHGPEELAKRYPVQVRAGASNVHDQARGFWKAAESEWRTTKKEAERLAKLGLVNLLG